VILPIALVLAGVVAAIRLRDSMLLLVAIAAR
jgi:hypothetical protein